MFNVNFVCFRLNNIDLDPLMKNSNTDGNDDNSHYQPCRQSEFNNIYHYSAIKKPG